MVSFWGSAVAQATPEDVFAAWIDVERWPDGNVIEAARLNGAFEEGATVTSKAKGFPKSTLTITRVEPPNVWIDESRGPGVRMTFEHLVEGTDSGTKLTERVLITGPLSRIIGWVTGRRIEALFAQTTAQVARQAEAAPPGP